MIFRGPGFLAVLRFGSSPVPSHTLPPVLFFTQVYPLVYLLCQCHTQRHILDIVQYSVLVADWQNIDPGFMLHQCQIQATGLKYTFSGG
jgi:hypothetical protein